MNETSITRMEDSDIEVCVRLDGPTGGAQRGVPMILILDFGSGESMFNVIRMCCNNIIHVHLYVATQRPMIEPGSTMGDVFCISLNSFNNATSEKSPRMVGTARLADVRRVNATGTTKLFLIDDDGKVIVILFVLLLLSMQTQWLLSKIQPTYLTRDQLKRYVWCSKVHQEDWLLACHLMSRSLCP